jgi:hypothetical protein
MVKNMRGERTEATGTIMVASDPTDPTKLLSQEVRLQAANFTLTPSENQGNSIFSRLLVVGVLSALTLILLFPVLKKVFVAVESYFGEDPVFYEDI